MARMIFVNLPVRDLQKSMAFYEALGLRNEPNFTNEQAAMMVLSDTINVMLLRHEFYGTFTGKQIADAHGTSQVLLAISCEDRAQVDALVDAASANGGKADPGSKQDFGWMYNRSFEDPDGHHWEPMWMDAKATENGPEAMKPAQAGANRP